MKRLRIPILTILILALCLSAGCGRPGGPEQPAEPPDPADRIDSCEYTVTGEAGGGYTSLAVSRTEDGASLRFRFAPTGTGTETTADVAVDPEVLDRLAVLAQERDVAGWKPAAGAGGTQEAVTALRLVFGDGKRVFVSTADRLPEGAAAALQAFADAMYASVTADGSPVFGGPEAPVDITALAEPEPEASAWEQEAGEKAVETLRELRGVLLDEGAVYGIALLGYPDVSGGKVSGDRGYLSLMLEAEGYADWDFLARLPEDRFAEKEDGRVLYMILPLDQGAELAVYEKTDQGRGDCLFRGDGSLPLIVRCGRVRTEADVEIVLTSADSGEVSIEPWTDPESEQIVPGIRGYDCSAYTRAVG